MKTIILSALLAAGVASPSFAQYYERPPPGYDRPPPGYYPPPGPPPGEYDRRGDYPPPGPRYREAFGRRCDATLETRYGPRQMICPIVQPKPLGEPCGCPPPPGSGYRGQFVGGQTIR